MAHERTSSISELFKFLQLNYYHIITNFIIFFSIPHTKIQYFHCCNTNSTFVTLNYFLEILVSRKVSYKMFVVRMKSFLIIQPMHIIIHILKVLC